MAIALDSLADPAPRLVRPEGAGRLTGLRERIAGVRRRRERIRRLAGYATLGTAVITVAAAVFLVDWLAAPARLGRLGLLLAAAAGLGWVWWRQVRPWLSIRESDLDLALLVEREQGIDSDLVAALQFDWPGPTAAESPALRDAVVDYVAEFGRDWTVPAQVAEAAIRRRLAVLAVAGSVMLVAVAVRPDFAIAFLNRMALGSLHYPTATRIESLAIGGSRIDLRPWAGGEAVSPLGRPVEFEVTLGGRLPELAEIRLRGLAGGDRTTLDLTAPEPNGSGGWTGRLPRLLDTVDLQVFAGDAWTEPVRLRVVPLPIVDIELAATTPEHVAGRAGEPTAGHGDRQLAVAEGSSVTLAARCINKRLAAVAAVIDGERFPLLPAEDRWALAPRGTPLEWIEGDVRFELLVEDEDGLAPEQPLTGSIRVRPDTPPQLRVDLLTRLALPDGSPRLDWTAGDDNGIRSVDLLLERVVAADGDAEPATGIPPLVRQLATPPAGGRFGPAELPLTGSVAVPLASLGLVKGEQARVTLRAVDDRGPKPGRTATSEPIVIEITDETGLLASLQELDERSAKQIDALIERQLQVGDLPPLSSPSEAGAEPLKAASGQPPSETRP